jgi:hypothetical protein
VTIRVERNTTVVLQLVERGRFEEMVKAEWELVEELPSRSERFWPRSTHACIVGKSGANCTYEEYHRPEGRVAHVQFIGDGLFECWPA